MDKWIEGGNQLIIGGDWNSNVTSSKFLEPFKQRQLNPVMSSRHGAKLPATHNNGSYAIDEIFTSKTMDIVRAGYLEHRENLSDHRPVWFDVTKNSMIGVKASLKPTFATRKLKTNDPQIVNNNLSSLHDILLSHNIYERTNSLIDSMSSPMTKEQEE